jgi:SAM-dependent methyltransferase
MPMRHFNSDNVVKYIIFKVFKKNLYTEDDVSSAISSIVNCERVASSHSESFSCQYYQNLHETDCNFIKNNWLVDDFDTILGTNPNVILELGCGNGKFARKASQYCEKVIAVDWAKSPSLEGLPCNVEFLQRDISADSLPQADLTCSADFLEHLPFNILHQTISKIVKSSPCGYHKIACYDDGHSHLSIMPVWKWLNLFLEFGHDYKLLDVEFRRGCLEKQVITIGNIKL